jgi:hypothetical protein
VANFGDEVGRAVTVTVTSARYVEMLRNFLAPETNRRGIELLIMWPYSESIRGLHVLLISLSVIISSGVPESESVTPLDHAPSMT